MSCEPVRCMWFLIVLCLIVLCRINSRDNNEVHCTFATNFPPILCCSFLTQQGELIIWCVTATIFAATDTSLSNDLTSGDDLTSECPPDSTVSNHHVRGLATCSQETQKGNIFGNYHYPPIIPGTNAKRNCVSDIQRRAGRYRRHKADWRAASDAGNQTARAWGLFISSRLYYYTIPTLISRAMASEVWMKTSCKASMSRQQTSS